MDNNTNIYILEMFIGEVEMLDWEMGLGNHKITQIEKVVRNVL